LVIGAGKERISAMKRAVILALSLGVFSGWSASADPWKDESGKGRWRGAYEQYDDYYGRGWVEERKEKFRTADGCKVERKWKKGEYEEKVKCKDK
jgi:hypothetical protein